MDYPTHLTYWTADEVAECVPYREYLTDAQDRSLYVKLWSFVNNAKNPTPLGGDGSNGTVESPEERLESKHTDKVPHFWKDLEAHEQEAITKGVEIISA
jgi:hypothetical protein